MMPPGAIADQRGDRTWSDLRADLLKVQVHTLGIGGRGDDRRADRAGQDQFGNGLQPKPMRRCVLRVAILKIAMPLSRG